MTVAGTVPPRDPSHRRFCEMWPQPAEAGAGHRGAGGVAFCLVSRGSLSCPGRISLCHSSNDYLVLDLLISNKINFQLSRRVG